MVGDGGVAGFMEALAASMVDFVAVASMAVEVSMAAAGTEADIGKPHSF